MKNLAWKARTNYLPLVLDRVHAAREGRRVYRSQRLAELGLEVLAGQAPGRPADRYSPFGAAIRRLVCQHPARRHRPSDSKGYSPRRMTAVYAESDIDDWP